MMRFFKLLSGSILFFFLFSFVLSLPVSYIKNGGFQLPAINIFFMIGTQCDNWITKNIMQKGLGFTDLGFGQFVQLQNNLLGNGNISQIINLPQQGIYNLSFYQKAGSSNFSSSMMEIIWNGQVIATQTPQTIFVTYESFEIQGILGDNTLILNQIGNVRQLSGMCVDQLSLTYLRALSAANNTNITLTNQIITFQVNMSRNSSNQMSFNDTFSQTTFIQSQINKKEESSEEISFKILDKMALFYISLIFSLPLNQLTSLKYEIVFFDDMWLYYYDNRSYTGYIEEIFWSVSEIERMKFNVFSRVISIESVRQKLPFTNLTVYSRQKFVQIEQTDSTFLQAALPFFIYTVPLNWMYCLLFYTIFIFIYQHQLSKYVRRFYFFWTAFLQMIIEGNVSYFTYLAFSHFQNSFSMTFLDKQNLIFSYTFFFAVFLIVFLFYPMTGHYLKKQSCYFIFCLYRCPGAFLFLTLDLFRGVLKGTAHYFFFYDYQMEILALCCIEIQAICSSLVIEKCFKIFISKSMFCFYLMNSFLFICLNLALYLQTTQNLSELIQEMQKNLIILLFVCSIFMMAFDLLPYQIIKRKNRRKLSVMSKIAFTETYSSVNQ